MPVLRFRTPPAEWSALRRDGFAWEVGATLAATGHVHTRRPWRNLLKRMKKS